MIVNTEEKRQPARVSTARTRELGEELRQARQRANMAGSDVVDALEWSLGKLSKLETGTRGTSTCDIAALLGHYATDKATRDRVLAIATEPDTGSFLRKHTTSIDTLTAVTLHERTARTITTYQPLVVPPLAQTEDYTLALTGDHDTARARTARRQALREHKPCPRLVVYVHEAALRLVVGDAALMHEQLLQLSLITDWADTTVRVIPMNRPGQVERCHPATLLTFEAPQRPMAYAETDTATVFHDAPDIVTAYTRKMRALATCALTIQQTRDTLARWADVYDKQSARAHSGGAGLGISPQAVAGV